MYPPSNHYVSTLQPLCPVGKPWEYEALVLSMRVLDQLCSPVPLPPPAAAPSGDAPCVNHIFEVYLTVDLCVASTHPYLYAPTPLLLQCLTPLADYPTCRFHFHLHIHCRCCCCCCCCCCCHCCCFSVQATPTWTPTVVVLRAPATVETTSRHGGQKTFPRW